MYMPGLHTYITNVAWKADKCHSSICFDSTHMLPMYLHMHEYGALGK